MALDLGMDFVGAEALAQFADAWGQLSYPLIVTRGVVKEQYLDTVVGALGLTRYEVFSDFTPCPQLSQVESFKLSSLVAHDAIIAIGGGSAFDCAKAMKYQWVQSLELDPKAQVRAQSLPILCVATTFGSGAEITPFAVIYTKKGKISLSAPYLAPAACILVPQMGLSVPKPQRAAAAVDCLCQAIEAFWSHSATPDSKVESLECIKLCLMALKPAVLTDDLTAQALLARASVLSGRAICVGRTTAAHALSYYFTQYHGLAHGHAVALIMRSLFARNVAAMRDGSTLLHALGLSFASEFKPWFEQLLQELGLVSSFAALNLDEAAIAKAVASVNLQRLANNPATLTKDDLRSLIN